MEIEFLITNQSRLWWVRERMRICHTSAARKAARREGRPFQMKGFGGDRPIGRLEDGSDGGKLVSVGEELRRPACGRR